MDIELLKYKKMYRTKFGMENFRPAYKTLLVVQKGSFEVRHGDMEYTISENEAFLFRSDVEYVRHVIVPVTLYEYRFIADDAFDNLDKITFQDTVRLMSTFSLLDKLESTRFRLAGEYWKHLFLDILTLVSIETEEAMYKEKVRRSG